MYTTEAIDQATRWVLIRIYNGKTAANACRFLRNPERASLVRFRTILTERAIEGTIGLRPMVGGKEVTDRRISLRERAPYSIHEFDKLCRSGHRARLTTPRSPRTNGMVKRFNGRIGDVLQSHHVQPGKELDSSLHCTAASGP